ncbi:MAG: hypothetical protein ACE5OP_11180 [Candidatus Glassbacteria bacterium]
MRKTTVMIVLASLLLFGSCEKKMFEFTGGINQTKIFTLDEISGNFSESKTITAAEILDNLDVPSDARIKTVNVEALSLRVTVREDNEASLLTVSGSVVEQGGRSFLFQDYALPIEGAVGVDTPWVGLNALIATGISRLKGKLEGFIKGLDSQSFDISVSGASSPPGQRVALDLHLRVKITITYDQCVDVLKGAVGGRDCDI